MHRLCYVMLNTHFDLVPTSKNEWSYTSTPQYAFIVWCLVKHRNNFYQQYKLYSVETQYDLWIMDSEGCGREQSWSTLKHCPSIRLEGQKTTIAGLWTGIKWRDTHLECWPLYTIDLSYRDSSASIVPKLRTGRAGFYSRQGRDFLSSPPPPDRLWGPPASYPMGTGGKATRAWSWPPTSI
jgi:hypothetical protein